MELKQNTEIAEKTDFTEYYKDCIKNLKDTDYLTKRGISDPELLKRFRIGYDMKWQSPTAVKKAKEEGKEPSSIQETSRIIIPTSDYSYLARTVKDNEKHKVMKEGKVHLFNSKALVKSGGKPLFIVEGEIDTLSILECGFEVVGLTGTAFVNLLVSELKNMLSNKQLVPLLILYLDNDDLGKDASTKLETNLKELETFYVNFYEIVKESIEEQKGKQDSIELIKDLETLLKVKDPNEALTTLTNKKSFTEILLDIRLRTMSKKEEIRRDAEFEITKIKSSSKKKALSNYIKSSANNPVSATGFTQLDKILNGGFKGGWLYGIGAIPSLGKTTFVMQIADYIAQEEERNICVFSLEMSENDLMLKSIVRENYKIFLKEQSKEPVQSISKILQVNKKEIKKTTINDEHITKTKGWKLYFEKIGNHVHISQGIGDIGVQEIKQKVEEFASFEHKFHMVIVDYVQILSPYKNNKSEVRYMTDKQSLDKNIMELKRIARDKDIPIIVISSFNRESYINEVSFKSFKESGAVEYSTDVLIGLKLKVDLTTSKNDHKIITDDEKQRRINEAKNKYPREVELVVLKNRFGKAYDRILFKYYPQYEFFEEIKQPNFKQEINKQISNCYDPKKRKFKKNFA
jgi:replicative DNA helicase